MGNFCTLYPENIDVNILVSQTDLHASAGLIDPTSNLYDSKIYVFNGLQDATVVPGKCTGIYMSHIDWAAGITNELDRLLCNTLQQLLWINVE